MNLSKKLHTWLINGVSFIKRNSGILIGLIIMIVFLAMTQPVFLKVSNLTNVIRQISVNILLACSMTLVIIIGGIDLSVGSIIAISGCLSAGFITFNGFNSVVAILLSIVIGTSVGALNGLVVSRTNIPPFIVTLATMNIGRGLIRVYTHSKTILVDDPLYSFLGEGRLIGELPIQFLFIVFAVVFCGIILNKTKFGRNIYAVGDNKQAAEYTGINVKRVIFLVFVISGFLASLAGILTCTRTYSGQPNVGNGAEMDAISAVVLGGTSMTGGVGTIGGTIIGCMVIGIMNNGMNLMGIDSSWQYVVKGIVVLLAVFIDYVKKENKFSGVKARFFHKI